MFTKRTAQILVGLTSQEAERRTSAIGMVSRIISRDGNSFAKAVDPRKPDFRSDRVNLTIVNGLVTNADVG
jgi:hypothetical protein